jgi:hypothetical protein
VDTNLWLLTKGSGRDLHQEIVALHQEILAKTVASFPLMKEFWAALALGMTLFKRQDGVHLGWRGRPGFDGGLGGAPWTPGAG